MRDRLSFFRILGKNRTQVDPEHPIDGLRSIIGWSILPIIIWSVYQYAVWPGALSTDSLISWTFAGQNHFDRSHSLIYTVHIMLMRLIQDTPASVAFSQILMLAGAHGWAMSFLRQIGLSYAWVAAITILAALSPVNGFMASTLWKDVPYTAFFYMYSLFVF